MTVFLTSVGPKHFINQFVHELRVRQDKAIQQKQLLDLPASRGLSTSKQAIPIGATMYKLATFQHNTRVNLHTLTPNVMMTSIQPFTRKTAFHIPGRRPIYS